MGISTQGLRSKSLEAFRGQSFDFVITLCNKAQAECQSLPGAGKFIAWDFEDPTTSDKSDAFMKTLHEIQERIKMFVLVNEKTREVGMNTTLTPPRVFKCLADETRARIVLLIEREQELCVCELTCALDEAQPKVSRHLAQLRNCGLLADRRQGQWVYYRLHPQLPGWVTEILKIAGQANQDWLLEDTSRLDQMGDRPARVAACC